MSVVVKRKGEKVKGRVDEKCVSGNNDGISCVSDGLSASEFEGDSFKRPRVVSPVEVVHKKVSKSSAMDTMDESCCEGKIRKKVSKSKKKSEVKVSVEDEGGEKVEEVVELRVSKASHGLNARMREINSRLVDYLKSEGVAAEVILGAREITARFDGLLVESMLANERLRGKVDALEGISGKGRVNSSPVVLGPELSAKKVVSVASAGKLSTSSQVVSKPQVSVGGQNFSSPKVPVPMAVPKPVETWSLVVKGKPGVSSKEVIDKVRGEVGPTLGVRVHDLFALRNGGAVMRIPSVAERDKVLANKRFSEIGLEVEVRDKLGPKVVVDKVPSEISVDDFMSDLYGFNFDRLLSFDEFKKEVRLVSSPWNATGGSVNVVLEGSTRAMQHLLAVDRCYIKWFALRVREYNPVRVCHRCMGFDHVIRECKAKQDICRHCGQAGHVASRCESGIRCRNCALRGQPADHLMLSVECPIYGARLARENSRH